MSGSPQRSAGTPDMERTFSPGTCGESVQKSLIERGGRLLRNLPALTTEMSYARPICHQLSIQETSLRHNSTAAGFRSQVPLP